MSGLLKNLIYLILKLPIVRVGFKGIYGAYVRSMAQLLFNHPQVNDVFITHPFDDNTLYGRSDIDLAIKMNTNHFLDYYQQGLAIKRLLRRFPLIDHKGLIIFDDVLQHSSLFQQSLFLARRYPSSQWISLKGNRAPAWESHEIIPFDYIHQLGTKYWKHFLHSNLGLFEKRALKTVLKKAEKLFDINLMNKDLWTSFMLPGLALQHKTSELLCEFSQLAIPHNLIGLEDKLTILRLDHPLAKRYGEQLQWSYYFVLSKDCEQADGLRILQSISLFREQHQVAAPYYYDIHVLPEQLFTLSTMAIPYATRPKQWRKIFGQLPVSIIANSEVHTYQRFAQTFFANLYKMQELPSQCYKVQYFISSSLTQFYAHPCSSYEDFLIWGKTVFPQDFMAWLENVDRHSFGGEFPRYFKLFLALVGDRIYHVSPKNSVKRLP